jgi:SWI/SNF related-matrix-associated actin-dependent regulator of chromatin subfamily C
MYGEDWNKISDHVGTKSKEQCIMEFLQLPIEEPYLTQQMNVNGGSNLPFSQTDNPIMSTLAFLSSVVSPSIASAASKAALNEFSKQLKEKSENGMMTDSEDTTFSPSPNQIQLEKSTAIALSAASTKAYVLAQVEEKKLQKLVMEAVETQLKRLEIKLNHFDELETILSNERKQVERMKIQLFQEKISLKKSTMGLDSQPLHAFSPLPLVPSATMPPSQTDPNASISQL